MKLGGTNSNWEELTFLGEEPVSFSGRNQEEPRGTRRNQEELGGTGRNPFSITLFIRLLAQLFLSSGTSMGILCVN